MRILRDHRVPVFLFLLCVVGIAYAQSNRSSQGGPAKIGRYVIYYHPTNFNQALLLDTETATAWELVSGKFKSIANSTEEHEYRLFQRVGVEGIYKSSTESVAEQQLLEKMLVENEKQQKLILIEKEKQQKQTRDDAANLQSLKEIAAKSGGSTSVFASLVKETWPNLKNLADDELLRRMKYKFPVLAEAYPTLFEKVKDN